MTKFYPRTTWRPFVIFTALGFLISLAIFQLLDKWIRFFAMVYGKPDLGYHNLPPIIDCIQWALPWAVWLVLVAIFVLDMRRKDLTRTFGYFTGILLAFAASFMIAVIQWIRIAPAF